MDREIVMKHFAALHAIPEPGFAEVKTSAYLAEALKAAGYAVTTGIGGTGVVGVLNGGKPGKTVMVRADMDALVHPIGGKDTAVHSCGHDAHCSMVLTMAEAVAADVKGGATFPGRLKILFQPAEEKLTGALSVIEAGAVADVDIALGFHLRPIQEAKMGQATPALYHGASYILEAAVTGTTAHGARPHLGVNAIDAATAVVNAVNTIHMNPVVPWTAKTTKLQAGGASLNAIPDRADMAFDLRAQDNGVMEELIEKVKRSIEAGAATVGAKATVTVKGGVPAAEYDLGLVKVAREAIARVLGANGVLDPIVSPGGEDFHFFAKKIPGLRAAYIGLGCDLTPGLHHPEMKFNTAALPDGVSILHEMLQGVWVE